MAEKTNVLFKAKGKNLLWFNTSEKKIKPLLVKQAKRNFALTFTLT